MAYREVKGSLFFSTADALAHGVNCQGAMGAGIAAQFAKRWPEMARDYKAFCKSRFLFQGGDVLTWKTPEGRHIYNLATQYNLGPNATFGNVVLSVNKMLELAKRHGVNSIAMPRIGCGIGGLTWEEMGPAIKEIVEYHGADVTVHSL